MIQWGDINLSYSRSVASVKWGSKSSGIRKGFKHWDVLGLCNFLPANKYKQLEAKQTNSILLFFLSSNQPAHVLSTIHFAIL